MHTANLGQDRNNAKGSMTNMPIKERVEVAEWIKKMGYIYTMEYYSAIRKKQILPFAATWIELEDIMLSEISQAEKDKYQMISLIRGV